jgi:peptidoglycan/LPS O-acetylase OafA/YrhL
MTTPLPPAAEGKDYRVDIDGLRGIAVLSVILFHIDSRLLPGGFVGVDIFFVISGYLISLHIFSEIEAGRFSLAEFYRRRIKRIAPAMLAVVAATLLLTQTLFVPDDAEVAAEAAFFSLFSLANVYFWLFLDGSYFAASTDEQPLLHLWSLGVEEQFYIIWPLLLMAFYRGRKASGFILVCAIVAVASFVLGDALYPHDPSFVFYMLPTRAGELLLGALAAQLILRRPTDGSINVHAVWVSTIGAALVIGSCFWTQETKPFPGWRAIPPTLGSAMLIVAGHYRATVVTRMLCWKPLVWLGVVSYSAYLWHWPILAIPRYFGVEFGIALGAAAFVATVSLAWLSYRYIEVPARRSRLSFTRVAWRQYAAPAGLLAVLCIAAKVTDGYGPRLLFPTLGSRLAAAELETQPAFESDYICQRPEVREEHLVDPKCIVGHLTSEDPKIILWGDSNASHYVGMLGAFAENERYSFRNVEAMGCPPVLHDMARIVPANKLQACSASAAAVATHLFDYSVVWIAADWRTYDRISTHFVDAFEATVREIARDGRRVVILGKAPVIAGYDRRCRQKAVTMPFLECEYPDVPLPEDVVRINARLANIARAIPGVSYFDANTYLCPNGICPLNDEVGRLIYYDPTHISLDASWRLGARILDIGVPEPFRRSN